MNTNKTFLIAEIGINHNGKIALAKKLIDLAKKTGFDAVKFQKRTPEITTPNEKKYDLRDTPWGKITYPDYKKKIEESIITQIDAKTKLQELSLKRYKKLPTYKIISNTGPRHKPILKVAVKLPNSKFYIADGSSKKDAEQNAAILCLRNNI